MACESINLTDVYFNQEIGLPIQLRTRKAGVDECIGEWVLKKSVRIS
jgi:hypothetical protein